jgi:hypothetical protein
MQKTLDRLTSLLLIPSLAASVWQTSLMALASRTCGLVESGLTPQALAARPTAFHHNESAIFVCALAASLSDHAGRLHHSHQIIADVQRDLVIAAAIGDFFGRDGSPPVVLQYLCNVAKHITRIKKAISDQIRNVRLNKLEHETEFGFDLGKHLVIGLKGIWLHSHLKESGHGILLDIQRNRVGRWKPVAALIEHAYERGQAQVPPYFFAVNAVIKSRIRRDAILSSAEPFVDAFEPILRRVKQPNDSVLASHAMGRGITPGAEGAWVMEPLKDWDVRTGLWMDPSTGWVFLRADKDRGSISPAEEAVFILKSLAQMTPINRRTHQIIRVPLTPSSEHITRQDLTTLFPWIEALSNRWMASAVNGFQWLRINRQITPEEIAYIKFLIALAGTGSTVMGQKGSVSGKAGEKFQRGTVRRRSDHPARTAA